MDTPPGTARTVQFARSVARGHRRGADPAPYRGQTPPMPRSAARDEGVSRAARGLLAELWTHKRGWTITVAALYAATASFPSVEGKDALYDLVRELRSLGYLRQVGGSGWTTRYALNRNAAPPGDEGWVHVPWEVARDRRLSYRARGLLVERLSYGATLRGQTVTVHRGGVVALAGRRRGECERASATDLDALLTLGYAARERTRDERGRLHWRMVFRVGTPDPVDNPPHPDPAPTCDEDASSQVAPTPTFSHRRAQEDDATCATCGNTASAQVGSSDPVSGAIGEPQGSLKGRDDIGVRSVRSVQVGDARAYARPLRGTQDHSRPVGEGGPVHAWAAGAVRPGPPVPEAVRAAGSGQAPLPRRAWQALAQLPRAFRDGAPPWVRRELARRLGRLLEGGLSAAALVATARRVLAERPINGDHVAALAAVHTRLRCEVLSGDTCGHCGTARFARHGRCPACDADRELDEREHAQLEAAWAHLTGGPPPGTPDPRAGPAPPPAPALTTTALTTTALTGAA